MTSSAYRTVSLLVAILSACTVGDISTGNPDDGTPTNPDPANPNNPPDDDTPTGQGAITLSAPVAATTKLGTTVEVPVMVSGTDLTGSIALAVSGAPAGWTVSVVPTTVDASQATEVHIVAQIPTNAVVTGGSQMLTNLTLTATSGAASKTVTAPITLTNQLDLSLASGGVHQFSGMVRVKAGAQLLIKNNDTASHQVHASAPLAHQGSPMAAGATYTQTPASTGQVSIYCHIHQGTGTLQVIVE